MRHDLTCPWASEHGCGVVFKLDTTNQETVLYPFRGKDDGYWPYGLIREASGNLYGTTAGGGTPTCFCGTVFKIEHRAAGRRGETLTLRPQSQCSRNPDRIGLYFE